MTEIKMLPLPKWCYADKHLHVGSAAIRKEMRAYARANVASLQTENERLRAEREVIVAESVKYADKSGRLEARAELLAEALREVVELDEEDGDSLRNARAISRAALRDHDQEDEK